MAEPIVASDKKISHKDFVENAIRKLRKKGYKGIHSVYSGFNQAFRDYFEEDPVKVTKELVEKGVIAARPVKGGVLLYLAAEYTEQRNADTLKKILD